jgi:hypothetical protein
MGVINNYLVAMKASRNFGKALKSQRYGNEELALSMVHQGLSSLASSSVNRRTPHTSSVLIQLTILCEHLATKLQLEGASKQDLEDAHINITRIYGHSGHEYQDFLNYIERKLGYVPRN